MINSNQYSYNELYFGCKPVQLSKIDGLFDFYNHHNVDNTYKKSKLSKLLDDQMTRQSQYNQSLINLDLNDQEISYQIDHKLNHIKVVVPCMPCIDLSYIDKKTNNHQDTDIDKYHQQYNTLNKIGPIIKLNLTKYDGIKDNLIIQGLSSGVRSAIINQNEFHKNSKLDEPNKNEELNNTFFRLKGCGNNDQGFVIRKNISKDADCWYDLRGCAFEHTAIRENYITTLIEKTISQDILSLHNKFYIPNNPNPRTTPLKFPILANSAIGMYKYSRKPLGDYSAPVCIIQRTIGERRLGTHGLAGLTQLIPMLVDESGIDSDALSALFPANRQNIKVMDSNDQMNEPYGYVSTAQLMTDHNIAINYSVDIGSKNGFTWPELKRDRSIFVEFLDDQFDNLKMGDVKYKLKQAFPELQNIPFNQKPDQQNSTTKTFDKFDEKWNNLWSKACTNLNNSIKLIENSNEILPYLYQRIGYECGSTLSYLHNKTGLSWGTQTDLMCQGELGEMHCNAHSNNMVILNPYLPSSNDQKLLGFLDLDMAQDAASYVKQNPDGDTQVGVSEDEFFKILKMEMTNFIEVLVGADASTGLPLESMSELRKRNSSSENHSLYQIALYDVLICGYMKGYLSHLNDEGGRLESSEVAARLEQFEDMQGLEWPELIEHNDNLHKASVALLELSIMIMANVDT